MNFYQSLKKSQHDIIIPALSASFLLSTTLCFFGPATIYYTNIFEFFFTFSDIFPLLVSLTIVVGLLFTVTILGLFKGKIHRTIVCIVFSLGLLFYIQGNIFIWNYGLLDGHEIMWNNYIRIGIFELLVWIVILAIFIIKSEKIYRYVAVSCMILVVIQTIGLFSLVINAPSEPLWKNYNFIDDKSRFNFSDNSNVIVIVLDTFRSDIFQEIINEEEEYNKTFQGFTYYRNAAGGFPSTMASIPLMMTGVYYNNSKPFDEYVNTSYQHASLPKTLKENGYLGWAYESNRLIYPDPEIFSNARKNTPDYVSVFISLGQLVIFRHSPHFIKEATFPLVTFPLMIDQSSYYQSSVQDQIFYNELKTQTLHLEKNPIFKFYHLNGAHPPFQLNENIEIAELPNNHSGYKEQAKASLKIAGELISKLKLAGIYDNSMIIITGDHGLNGEIISEGVPLILYKPFYTNDTLKISDAPVSLSDYPITVTTALNLSSNFAGISMLDRQESDTRQRLFYDYSWENEYWSHAYLPPMQEYIITNFSWSDDSWQLTYRDYYPNEVRVSYPPEYHLGAKVYFGQDQKSSDKYLNWGWSNPEKSYVWSNGNTARIVFLMNNTDSDLRLHLALTPFVVENKQGKQRVLIDLNHHEIANLSLDQNRLSDEEIVISHEYLNESLQCITFYLPDARSPSDLGLSSDYRNLAIALTSFNISRDVENQILYGEGWYPPENWSGTDTRWMNSHATLVFYSDESRMGTINMQIVSFASPRNLEIITTDQRESQVTVPTYFVTAVMPVDIHKGKNILHFNTSVDCKIPVIIPELNSNDTRCLSVAVQNITIS